MPSVTNNYELPYPLNTDPANFAVDIKNLAETVDTSIKNISVDVKRITANYSSFNGDYLIADSTSPIIVSLPSSPQENNMVRISQFSTGIVTLTSSATINGSASTNGQGSGISAVYTNGAWWCVPFSSSQQGAGWTRPSDWLPLPDLIEGEEVIYGIMRIYQQYNNTFSVTVQGGYIIDWGDGTTDTISAGGEATHTYDYALIPENTLIADGYKQAIIEIRPVSGQTLTTFWAATSNGRNGCRFSEVKMTGPYLSDVGYYGRAFFDTYSLIIKYPNQIQYIMLSDNFDMSCLENIEMDLPNCIEMSWCGSYAMNVKSFIANTSNNLIDISGIFSDSGYNNAEILISDTSSVTNLSNAFARCYIDDNNIPVLDTSSVTNMDYTFNWCPKIKKIPTWLNTSSVTSAYAMFTGSANLEEIPSLDMSNVLNAYALADNCGRLRSSGIYGISVSHSYKNCNLDASALNTIYSNLASVSNSTFTINNIINNDGYTYYYFSTNVYLGAIPLVVISGTDVLSMNKVVPISGSYWNGSEMSLSTTYLNSGYTGINPTVFGSLTIKPVIDVTGNPGLISDNPAIATNKGWEVIG